jgi:hypothetical protein
LAKQVASDADGDGRDLIKPLLPQLIASSGESVGELVLG